MTKLSSVSKQVHVNTKPEYPYIGKCKDTNKLVLFTSKDSGVILGDSGYYDVGYYSYNWDESNYQHFIGSVTITSEK